MAVSQSNTEKNEVQAFWNDFSNYYGSTLEDYSLKSALALSKMLRLSSAKNILEVGCATGSLSLHLLHFLPPGTTYTAIDFSETMIKTAQQRKESLKQKLNDVNHTFRVGDAEDLSFVPSESVDVYISPLCLHLVPNIEKALAEALRVTKKGGRIGFSILGPFEKNSFYSVFDSNVYEVVKQRPPVPMIPHLLDKEKAVELAQKAGIKVDFCWEEETAYDIFSEKELENIQRNSAYAKMFREASEEVQAKIMEGVKVDFDKLKNNFTPLKTNNLLLVGRKQE